MIAVLADDLTGAAELGGIGLHYNLKVEISSEVNQGSAADLLIIYTNSRSMKKEEAVKISKEKLQQLAGLNPRIIYKKVDSVLRGHIASELDVQMKIFGKDKALLIPANPHLDRTISKGEYFIKGIPLSQTSFARDPEFPITSSKVSDILSREGIPVEVIQRFCPLTGTGIKVGEVEKESDFPAWLKLVDDSTVLAGGSGFFTAILDSWYEKNKNESTGTGLQLDTPALIVSGTSFRESLEYIARLKAGGIPVSYMPLSITHPSPTAESLDAWAKDVQARFADNDMVIMAMHGTFQEKVSIDPVQLTKNLSLVVAQVLQTARVRELFIEGGSTAFAIITQLDYKRFYPVEELTHGVIRMKVEGEDLHLTIKPGSYAWPQLSNLITPTKRSAL